MGQFFAPVSAWWQPEIFSWVFTGRRSRSAAWFVAGTARSTVKRRYWSLQSRSRSSRFVSVLCFFAVSFTGWCFSPTVTAAS